MELWNKITGTVTLELTAADPERILGDLAGAGIRLWDLRHPTALCVVMKVARGSVDRVCQIVEKDGGKLRFLGWNGVYYALKAWRKRPVLLVCMLILAALSRFVPSRVLFVEVQGNETVPSRLILETAAQVGLEFGASRRSVRSERIKNELLGAIEELEWVGVNTSGCTATITVRERRIEPEGDEQTLCNIVAAADGIVEDITMIRGTLLCQVGQAVREGQILVSGIKDLEICSRAVEAEAEIYALTLRQKEAVLPAQTLTRGAVRDETVRFSVIFGKKRINLYSDSGILPTTCGKMIYSIPLCLPGGLSLPITLVVERCTFYETSGQARDEETAQRMLSSSLEQQVLRDTIAGRLLTRREELELLDDRYVLRGSFECREMIARQQSGVYLEGDTNDDKQNSQRGAG